MDAELGYSLNNNITLVAGAENFIDTTPTNQSNNASPYPSGMQYAETSPYGFNGGILLLQGDLGLLRTQMTMGTDL